MKRPLIFLCHSSVDKAFVRELVSRLRRDGVDCWLDEVEIRVGESIHQKINDGLTKSDFFTVVLSAASVKSKWVQDELASASSMEKYKERGIFILPILWQDCDIPPLLLDRRYANFRDDQESAYQELLDSIRHHFGARHPDVDVSALRVAELTDELVRAAASHPEVLNKLAPRHFEALVANLMRRAGYDVNLSSTTQDGGYDIVAHAQSKLPGISGAKLLIQCKRYTRLIGVDEVAKLAFTSQVVGSDRAMLVTSSSFTKKAKEVAEKAGIDLVDAAALADWIQRLWSNSDQ